MRRAAVAVQAIVRAMNHPGRTPLESLPLAGASGFDATTAGPSLLSQDLAS